MNNSDYKFLKNPIPIRDQSWDKDNDTVVSIACITYNHEKYIRDTIEGFLMQKTTFPVEIIIHDDASTDNAADIIREYAEENPKLFSIILQDENQWSKKEGSIYGRFVFPEARGKYIALCDGDDYWTDPLKLQKQVEFLEENSSYAGASCYNNSFIYKDDSIVQKNNPTDCQFKSYSFYDFLKTGTPGLRTCSMMYRNSNVFRNMLNDNILDSKANGDRIFLTYMLKNTGNIALLPFVGSVYRIHSEGVSGGLSGLEIRNEIRRNYEGVLNKILTENEEKNLLWKKNLRKTWKSDLKNFRIKSIVEDFKIYKSSLKN